jgi:hypothetical protein
LLVTNRQQISNGDFKNYLIIRLWVLNISNSDQTLSIHYCLVACDGPDNYIISLTFDPITVTSKSFYELKLKISKISTGNFQIKVGDQASPVQYAIDSLDYLKLSFDSADINISNLRYYIGK